MTRACLIFSMSLLLLGCNKQAEEPLSEDFIVHKLDGGKLQIQLHNNYSPSTSTNTETHPKYGEYENISLKCELYPSVGSSLSASIQKIGVSASEFDAEGEFDTLTNQVRDLGYTIAEEQPIRRFGLEGRDFIFAKEGSPLIRTQIFVDANPPTVYQVNVFLETWLVAGDLSTGLYGGEIFSREMFTIAP